LKQRYGHERGVVVATMRAVPLAAPKDTELSSPCRRPGQRVKSQEALTTTQAAVREAEARAQAQVACVVSLERRVADEREQSAHLRSRVEELLQDQAALHTQLESQAHKAAEAAAAIQSLQQQLEVRVPF